VKTGIWPCPEVRGHCDMVLSAPALLFIAQTLSLPYPGNLGRPHVRDQTLDIDDERSTYRLRDGRQVIEKESPNSSATSTFLVN
jgi:hypothetical protein